MPRRSKTHKRAYAAYGDVLGEHSKLEDELPQHLRKSSVDVWEAKIVGTEQAVLDVSEAETDAAMALVDVRPTTQAGMFALLEYVLLHEKRDRLCWPSDLEDDEGKQRPWHYFMLENLAVSLTLGVSA